MNIDDISHNPGAQWREESSLNNERKQSHTPTHHENETNDHPHYRYNHYPQRWSSSYSSSNLSSYSSSSLPSLSHRLKASSPTSTEATESISSLDPSSPQNNDKKNVDQDGFSIESALSLYQAFASSSTSDNTAEEKYSNNLKQFGQSNNEEQWATLNNMSMDETISSNNSNSYIGDINDNNMSTAVGGDERSLSQIIDNSTTNCIENNGDDESTTSNSSSSTQNNYSSLSYYTNLISQQRKKIGTVALSMATIWIYSQYHKSKHQSRRCNLRKNNGRYINRSGILGRSKILGVYHWLMNLLSSLRISKYFKQLINNKLMQSSSQQATLSQSAAAWNNAATTPLSHLLATAKAGNISKVLLRGSVLTYLHTMQSPSSSSSTLQNQHQSKKKERWSKTTLPSQNPNILNEIISNVMQHGCDDITTLPESLWSRFMNGPAIVIFPFAYLGALYYIMRRLQKQQFEDEGDGEGTNSWRNIGGGGSGNNTSQVTTFDDVAGIDSSLQELSEVISYMRNPSSFHNVGALPPRGILLHGPPGSGKTLLARAIAGEAERSVDGTQNVGGNTIDRFAVCSGSEFVETYVGRGAARVRSLFRNVRDEAMKNFNRRQKRKQLRRWNTTASVGDDGKSRAVGRERSVLSRTLSQVSERAVDVWNGVQSFVATNTTGEEGHDHQRPMAIIFIDEIDALAKRRDSGLGLPSSLGGGGCDEREQTLNQLLCEMDGFASGSPSSGGVNIIVIAATNRPDVLDPAILRAGRFDRHVKVALPDACGREAILHVHARRIRWDRSSVKFCELPTHNFSGADLKNVINEAALLAVRRGSSVVTQDHLLEAVQKVRTMISLRQPFPGQGQFRH